MNLKRKLFYKLPPAMRFAVRRLYYLPTDIWQQIVHPNKLMPPKGKIYTGAGNFLNAGTIAIDNLVSNHGLMAHHAVLDIGSGIGRLAIPLTKVLNQDGMYRGFDVIEMGVSWCKKHITKTYPNFEFLYVPLHNDLYTSSGQEAKQFQFPYANNTFNYALANSLFTHMMPLEVANYFLQLYKVMQKGGRVYATFFLIPDADTNRLNSNPTFSFPVMRNNYALMDEVVTSANIAFLEDYLFTEIILPTQFKVVHKSYGYWFDESRASSCTEFQDILILEKI